MGEISCPCRSLRPRSAVLTALGLAAIGCTGAIGPPVDQSTMGDSAGREAGGPGSRGGASGEAGAPGMPATSSCRAKDLVPQRAPLRRLTASQYNNALQALLQDPAYPPQTLPAEAAANGGFLNDADNQAPSDELVSDHLQSAAAAAARIVKDGARLIGCSTNDVACATQFIKTFGQRAFRRPLTDVEASRYSAFFSAQLAALPATLAAGTDGTPDATRRFKIAIQLVAEALLMSPQFIYSPELGQAAKDGVKPLTPHEYASRLAFLITDSIPDDALLDAASKNQLSTPEQIGVQVKRLMATPRARNALGTFHHQWLQTSRLEAIAGVQKNRAVFPQWNDDIKASMRNELTSFVASVVFDGDGKLGSLFTSNRTWVDASLAKIYGVTAPQGGGFVTLDAARRAGLLTQAAYLAGHAHQTQASPVWRGQGVLSQLLCAAPPPPPNGVNTTVSDTAGLTTTGRQRQTAHLTNPGCAVCHLLMDNIGFTFENYDAIGGYRTLEGGQPVDSHGDIVGTDFDGSVASAIELSARIATSRQVQACATIQWFRYAFGRLEGKGDDCTIAALTAAFASSRGNIPDLISTIANSPAFMALPVQ